jgi:hypothetical protein
MKRALAVLVAAVVLSGGAATAWPLRPVSLRERVERVEANQRRLCEATYGTGFSNPAAACRELFTP